MNNFGVPYRAPCGGWPTNIKPVPQCFNHKNAADKVPGYVPSTYPLPLPVLGNMSGTGCLNCGSTQADIGSTVYAGVADYHSADTPCCSGADWRSAYFPPLGHPYNGTIEHWQYMNLASLTPAPTNPIDLLNAHVQTSALVGMEDLGQCHKYNFKCYGAMRFWHGMYGLTSGDNLSPPTGTPDQSRYTVVTLNNLNYSSSWFDSFNYTHTYVATANGSVQVNPLSGETTSTLITTEDDSIYNFVESQLYYSNGGAGSGQSGSFTHGGTSCLDNILAAKIANTSQVIIPVLGQGTNAWSTLLTFPANGTIADLVTAWNNLVTGNGVGTYLPAITDPFNYNNGTPGVPATAYTADAYHNFSISIEFSKTNSQHQFNIRYDAFPINQGWPANTVLQIGYSIQDGNGNYQTVTGRINDCKTGSSEPTWANPPLGAPWGANTTDNNITWACFYMPGCHLNYSGTITLSGENRAEDVRADVENNLLQLWTLNGPEPWRHDSFFGVMPWVARRELQRTVSPWRFIPATMDDLSHPIADSNGTAPFTTGGTLDWIPTYQQIPWADMNCWSFSFPTSVDPAGFTNAQTSQIAPNGPATGLNKFMDGDIIGAPHVKGPGAVGWFDFYQFFAAFCPCGASPCSCTYPFGEYIYSYGGTAADFYVNASSPGLCSSGNDARTGPSYASLLPQNATHWSNNEWIHGIPRSALIDIGGMPTFNGQPVSGTGTPVNSPIVAVKAAFARLPVPSYNFARPCGSDRVLIDEATAVSLTLAFTSMGSYGSTCAFMSTGMPSLTGKTILVYGTSHDGIYTGATTFLYGGTDPTLRLDGATKIADIPTDYYHAFCGLEGGGASNFPNGFVGIVRFPNCPALCGRQRVASFTDAGGGSVNVVFSSPQTNLRVGDALDFWDSSMGALPANCPVVTRTDDTHFVVTASFAGMSGAIYATSHGAANWYWNDDSQKMEFRWGEFDLTNRPTSGVAFVGSTANGTPGCQKLDPCNPQVVAFTPNNDTDPAWESHWFGSLNFDGALGSRSQLVVEFEIPDLLYQTPLKPDGSSVAEDDGSCLIDSLTLYYPPHPRVEARVASPDGGANGGAGASGNEAAPDFTTDALGNKAAWPAMTRPLNPGTIGNNYTVYLDPGQRYANELASGSGCRFSKWYYAWTLGKGV